MALWNFSDHNSLGCQSFQVCIPKKSAKQIEISSQKYNWHDETRI